MLNSNGAVTSDWVAPEIAISSSAAADFEGDLLIVAFPKVSKSALLRENTSNNDSKLTGFAAQNG